MCCCMRCWQDCLPPTMVCLSVFSSHNVESCLMFCTFLQRSPTRCTTRSSTALSSLETKSGLAHLILTGLLSRDLSQCPASIRFLCMKGANHFLCQVLGGWEYWATWLGKWFAHRYALWVSEFDMKELETYEVNAEILWDTVVSAVAMLYWTYHWFQVLEDEWRSPGFCAPVWCSLY